MKTLLLDTALETSLVAVADGERVTARIRRHGRQGHSADLLKDVEYLLHEAGYGYKDLDLIGVGVGPGSFTGVRVAVSTAKGLAFGGNIPVVGVSTIRAIALSFEGNVSVVINAGRGRVYLGGASPDISDVGDIKLIHMEDLPDHLPDQPMILVGPAVVTFYERILTILSGRNDRVLGGFDGLTAEGLLAGAIERFKDKGPDDPASLAPMYIQAPAIKKRVQG